MKMAKWIIAASIFLVGCGNQEPSNQDLVTNYGYGYDYQQFDDGLRVRHTEGTAVYDVSFYRDQFNLTMWCAGVDPKTMPQPLIVVVPQEPRGVYFPDTNTVVISEWDRSLFRDMTLRHEFIHLYLNATNQVQDHEHPAFKSCV